MGQQTNKHQKRLRRKRQIKRLHAFLAKRGAMTEMP